MQPTETTTPVPHSDPDPFAKFIGELLPFVFVGVIVIIAVWYLFIRND